MIVVIGGVVMGAVYLFGTLYVDPNHPPPPFSPPSQVGESLVVYLSGGNAPLRAAPIKPTSITVRGGGDLMLMSPPYAPLTHR